MPLSNFERLVKLAEEVFEVRNDPTQLDINTEVLEKLRKIHPSTISDYDQGEGPVAWILLIPTTSILMNQFLDNTITEKELFVLTPLGAPYEVIYLCSALVLEEYRRKGIAQRLSIQAIKNIRKDHSIDSLFYWPFTKEGELAAENLAKIVELPIYKFVGSDSHK